MAAKKKTTKKPKKAKKPARKKSTPAKVRKNSRKLTKKKSAPKRTIKKTAAKSSPARKKTVPTKKASSKKPVRKRSDRLNAVTYPSPSPGSRSDEQSGDLQGLSRRESADSESVEELIEEGNAFEAEVVSGVESADNADEREAHTHEVPEDDVPEEYLDKD